MTYSIAIPVERRPYPVRVNRAEMIVWPQRRYRVLEVSADSPWDALEFVEKQEGVKGCRILVID